MVRSLVAFAAVGAVAALVHLGVATALLTLVLSGPGVTPALIANAAAFVVAFLVSYSGQRNLTFRSSRSHTQSLPRYFLVAVSGLGVNEVVVAIGIRALGMPAVAAIALGIVCAAALTFVASRIWVFQQHGPAGAWKP
jgi:putative flippase GtrA